MEMRMTVDGDSLKGFFRVDGLDQRPFAATIGADGVFNATTTDSFGVRTQISGTIRDGVPEFSSAGHCKFKGRMSAVANRP
jgi:hypothetical protein